MQTLNLIICYIVGLCTGQNCGQNLKCHTGTQKIQKEKDKKSKRKCNLQRGGLVELLQSWKMKDSRLLSNMV